MGKMFQTFVFGILDVLILSGLWFVGKVAFGRCEDFAEQLGVLDCVAYR